MSKTIVILFLLYTTNSFGVINQNDKAGNVCPLFVVYLSGNNIRANIMEQWKPVKGYEKYYEISTSGRIRSLTRDKRGRNVFYKLKGKELKPFKSKKGYLYINLSKDGIKKKYLIHTLVWDNFGDKDRKQLNLKVDHIDDSKINNNIKNLQLLTNRQNISKSATPRRKSGLPTCVYKSKNRHRARCQINGVAVDLGTYGTPEEAHLAYTTKIKEISSFPSLHYRELW